MSAFAQLQPAIVVDINERTASVLLKKNQQVTLNWENIKWAKPYLTHSRQGKAPTN